MSRNITIYLQDILDNMENADRFLQNMTYEAFSKDLKTSYAVVRCIEIIGEAAKKIPRQVRQQYPAIPWKEMAGMRDKVIHFYFGVNQESIWLAVKERIPEIKPLIRKALQDLQSE